MLEASGRMSPIRGDDEKDSRSNRNTTVRVKACSSAGEGEELPVKRAPCAARSSEASSPPLTMCTGMLAGSCREGPLALRRGPSRRAELPRGRKSRPQRQRHCLAVPAGAAASRPAAAGGRSNVHRHGVRAQGALRASSGPINPYALTRCCEPMCSKNADTSAWPADCSSEK